MAVDSIGVSLDNPSIGMEGFYDGDGGEVQYPEFADETSAESLYDTNRYV